MQVAGITNKNVQRDMLFQVKYMIERYGDDGMGDKPPEISRITYWAQHLSLDKYTKKQEEAEKRAEKRATKRVKT